MFSYDVRFQMAEYDAVNLSDVAFDGWLEDISNQNTHESEHTVNFCSNTWTYKPKHICMFVLFVSIWHHHDKYDSDTYSAKIS